MSQHRTPSAPAQDVIAALAVTPRLDVLGPIAARFIHALRLIALHERAGRDPVPELAVRLGGVEIAAKALILSHAIAASWPENIHVSRFCCRLLSHDELTIGAFIDAAARRDRAGFEAALTGLVRAERMHRLWEGALLLVAAELRSV
ncbi:MAG: DNA-directed RNA polymerase subunit beta' [Erythrobacter sp.]|nr:DNA-directed RNA polymerase subunit beta' [Erythrobacter sp.]